MELCANSNINWTKNIFAFAIPMGETNISHYNYLKSSLEPSFFLRSMGQILHFHPKKQVQKSYNSRAIDNTLPGTTL